MHTKLFFAKKAAVAAVAVAFLFSPLFIVFPGNHIQAETLEEQLERLEKEIAQIRLGKQGLNDQIASQKNKIGIYSGEIGSLRAEMEGLQFDIAEIDLQIKELEVNIAAINKDVEEKEASIAENQQVVNTLETETKARITHDYMDYRARGMVNVDFLPSEDPNTYFKDSQYKSLIQEQANRDIDEMLARKVQLEKDRAKLDANLSQLARNKAIVDEQSSQLDKAKEDLQSKIDGYYKALYQAQANINYNSSVLGAYSEQEAKKQAQAEAVRQQIFNQFSPIGSGQYVIAGTQIGRQGSTGWSTGPHLHFSVAYNGSTQNPCIYLPGDFVAECGGNGSLAAPMHGSFYYTSKYYSGINGDLRCISGYGCSSHPAIDVANSIWNAPIYAAHDGWLYKGVDQYGALYIIICANNNCNQGFKTGYWHLSQY